MRYIQIHDDDMPGAMKDCNVPVTPGDSIEQILQKVHDLILYVDRCVQEPQQ